MTDFADFEITLYKKSKGSYGVQLRFRKAGSDADTRLLDEDVELQFDSLPPGSINAAEYGKELWRCLSADGGKLALALSDVRKDSQEKEASLRVRLLIGPNAPELHKLRWETLRDAAADGPLLTGELIYFSRYLSSSDWRPVKLRAYSELRALAVAADPAFDPAKYPGLAAVKAGAEIERVRSALGQIPMDAICTRGEATLDSIMSRLRDGYDILYLVCHGAFVKGEPWVLLEDAQGQVAWTRGADLVTQLKGLQKQPRLIVLASCESAGEGEGVAGDEEGTLAALGPSLAEAGIPAVIAMHGKVLMRTVERFMPPFFDALRKDGQIDRSIALARNAVRSHPDWWMPVLYMRLTSGRLWYDAGFVGDDRGEGGKKWPDLLSSIRDEECTAIVGPGLGETLFGTRQEVAAQIAEEYRFPMGPVETEDLPQVAQYVSVDQSPKELQRTFGRHLLALALRRHGSRFPESLRNLDIAQAATEDVLIALKNLSEFAFTLSGRGSLVEEYRILAKLPFPLYVSTDPSDLLLIALQTANRKPRQMLCPWNKFTEKLNATAKAESGYRPSADEPLVYQLFGTLNEPKSLVLTVDDYFDYLIGVTSNKVLIPTAVRAALASTSLLFAGIRVEDWDFRVLLRTITAQEGHSDEKDDDVQHIAAQVTPEEGRIRQPKRAREYLQSYLAKTADINIYWGSAEDFLADLNRRWEAKYGKRPVHG